LLEKKVASLAHALISKPLQNEQHTVTQSGQPNPLETPRTQEISIDPGTHDQHAIPRISLGSAEVKSPDTTAQIPSPFSNLSPRELQSLLDRYTYLMAPHMPFVPITTASFATSPWLLQTIIAVAHFHSTSVQQTLVRDLVHQISSAVFTRAEKSLDLAQALLVLCAWYNPHLFTSTRHTTLLHLLMSLTTDLTIDRDPATCEMAHLAAAMKSCGIPQPVKPVSDEERRVVLGVFWVASTVFTSFRKTDVPNWTPWLQTCLSALAETGLESDKLLVSLVQSQRIMHQAMASPVLHDPVASQSELDCIRPADEHAEHGTIPTLLRLQCACALIAVWEPSFSAHHLDGVWSCIAAIASYLTTYASLPVAAHLTVPFTVFAQFAYTFVVIVRATSLHFDGFDGTLLRKFIDFEKVMVEASEKYDAVKNLRIDGQRVNNEGFESWAEKCRWARTWWGMKAREDAAGTRKGESGGEESVLTGLGESLIRDDDWTHDRLKGIDLDFGSLGSALM
jgi:hypothetical protein